MDRPTVASALKEVRLALSEAGIAEAAQDARVLVSGILGLTSTDLILHEKRALDEKNVSRLEAAVERRVTGEPVYRILGERSFYGLNFKLSEGTLEPRQDTEVLVDTILEALGEPDQSWRILDLGVGTGAIVLTLLHEMPNASGLGVDLSEDAIETAAENAGRLGLSERFEARKSNWFENVEGRFDVIVSNPPYIETAEIAALSQEVRRFDPPAALDGGPDGLAPYRIIAREAAHYLAENGMVGVEIGWRQKLDVSAIFAENGFTLVSAVADLAGNDRVLLFKY